MWKKETIILLSILLGISISGCTQQEVSVAEMTTSVEETTTQEETTITKVVVVKTTQSLLLESEEETTQSLLLENEEETISESEEEVETTKEIEDEKLKSCMAMFNGRKGGQFNDEEIEANNYLEENGYIVLHVNTDEEKNIGKVVTKEEAYAFYEEALKGMYYNEGWKGSDNGKIGGGQTHGAGQIQNEVMNKIREKNEKEQAQNFSNVVASHIKPGGGVALVINDLNPFGINGYTTNSMGYVVPTTESYNYYESLRKSDKDTFKIYDAVDNEVYAKNNQGKVNIIKKYTLPRLSYPVGTVREDGQPLWVQRDANFEVVNAHGQPFYAICSKTFPDLSVFCGGTTIAFSGWMQFRDDNFNGYYDWIAVKGGAFGTGHLIDDTQDNVDMMGLDQYTYVINYLNSIGSTIPGRP